MKKELKKFNLEEALAGQAVVTCDGIPVSQITKFNIRTGECVVAVVNGCLSVISEPDPFGRGKEWQKYLFMAPEKKWVNLYYDPEKYDVVSGEICDTKEEALNNCSYNKGGMKYIDTISFEI